jgi:hypothetical protein
MHHVSTDGIRTPNDLIGGTMKYEFSQRNASGKRQRLRNYVASPLTAAAVMLCAAPAAATVRGGPVG